MVERLHRQLKAAIMCHQFLDTDPAYGSIRDPLRLEGGPAGNRNRRSNPDSNIYKDASEFVQELRRIQQNLRPTEERHHEDKKTFIFKDLLTTNQVFVRRGGVKETLQQPYEGPFAVVQRAEKTFIVNIRGRNVTVSVDRLKHAYVLAEPPSTTTREEETPENIPLLQHQPPKGQSK
ncbi:uncharacterized protein LOC108735597 [Agrilus planipennis]|uniref:Uncharacterized protein LOC108735597 n=1 Tax=Agrilus planipennis TaxID=224129 RepID=A0A1W4WSJ2_AGRPL|nr:uncharacterized protein LOC108735597 [Agrilus planipennis]